MKILAFSSLLQITTSASSICGSSCVLKYLVLFSAILHHHIYTLVFNIEQLHLSNNIILTRFAAEIFHDLHEEVMATAARGHGLMLRVQQLEAEFPSIEKTFFTQTNNPNFACNDG